MFDRLIESEPETADFKNRRSYFMVSSVVVGILFLAAVVISIYAENFDMGNGSLEMSELIAPIEMAAAVPERVEPKTPATSHDQTSSPIRRENMASTSEPTIVPTTISSTPNTSLSRPPGNFILGDRDVNPIGSLRDISSTGPSNGIVAIEPRNVPETTPDPDPPPIKTTPPPVKKVVSEGVINGMATSLPKPAYSAAAKAVGAQGKVDVQVMIDESGRVIAANAVSGHPLLRDSAEKAARSARFSPTLLSKVPVKVTGVIVYNFVR